MPSWLHIRGLKQHNALPYKVTTLQYVTLLKGRGRQKATFSNYKYQKFEYINVPYQSQSNPLLFICILDATFHLIAYGVQTV